MWVDWCRRHSDVLSYLESLPDWAVAWSIIYLHQWLATLCWDHSRWSVHRLPTPPILLEGRVYLIWADPPLPLPPCTLPLDTAAMIGHQLLGENCPRCGRITVTSALLLAGGGDGNGPIRMCAAAQDTGPTRERALCSTVRLGVTAAQGAHPLPNPALGPCVISFPPGAALSTDLQATVERLNVAYIPASPGPEDANTARVMSVNCASVARKVGKLLDLLLYTDPDIVFLQEVGVLGTEHVPVPDTWWQASSVRGAMSSGEYG